MRHGYNILFRTLCPIFQKQKEEKYLKSGMVIVYGTIRRYYQTAPKGIRILNKA
jgi:hypothetical protein